MTRARTCRRARSATFSVRSASVMAGYWQKPEATAEVMRGDWYLTGDLGYRDDESYLYLVDRAKDMIVSGGENIYSTEVEDALASHPAVEEVAVFGVPDPRWGESVYAVVSRPAAGERRGTGRALPPADRRVQGAQGTSSCGPSRCPSRRRARSSSANCANRTGPVSTHTSRADEKGGALCAAR